MAVRAVWKGYLKIAELTCAVSLFTAVSTSERIAFHTLNRKTGNRVSRQFVDGETGTPVPREDQVKGYQIGQGDYVVLEPEELAAAVPESDKALAVENFVPPYFIAPSDAVAMKAYDVVREGLSAGKVAALARAVLFRRVRTVLVRPHGDGLMANLLNFDYEVRSSAEAFDTVPDLTIKDEMLDLATHIIKTKMGTFDPTVFDDRYENAVAEMVRMKMEGRPLVSKPAAKKSNVVNLLDALRESAKAADGAGKAAAKKGRAVATEEAKAAKRSTPSRKAG